MGSPTFPVNSTNGFINASRNSVNPLNPSSLNASVANTTTDIQATVQNFNNLSNVNASFGSGTDYEIVTPENAGELGAGSLAGLFKPRPGKELQDIIGKYPWTVSNKLNRSDIPYIQLREHLVDGGSIQKQLSFYAYGAYGTLEGLKDKATGSKTADGDVLNVYREIFPRLPTGFKYKFPYFAKAYYELSTPQWQQFDKISQGASAITSGLKKVLGGRADAAINLVEATASAAIGVVDATLAATYPVVGIADRPRIFTSHNERTVKIEFPLYNTINSWDWSKNKDFIHLFASQNLFNKRNFITGLPPVWYEVYVPGSYFSVASCVTQFDVQNLGNIRLMKYGSQEFPVPDAYQVSISLTEMALPSRNQFQSSWSGLGYSRVNSTDEKGDSVAESKEQTQPEPGNNSIQQIVEFNEGVPGAVNRTFMTGGSIPGFPPCWVARAVYGDTNPKWIEFRNWLLHDGPLWFQKIYINYGERFAKFIHNKPLLKKAIKVWMDYIIKTK